MTNPFEDENGTYFVLVNSENQHSLWPDYIAIPLGWSAVFGPGTRSDCLTYVNEHWVDMRPQSLIDAMDSRDK